VFWRLVQSECVRHSGAIVGSLGPFAAELTVDMHPEAVFGLQGVLGVLPPSDALRDLLGRLPPHLQMLARAVSQSLQPGLPYGLCAPDAL